MRILYEHRSPQRTKRKAALIAIGALMVAALVGYPPATLVWTWALWALASALLLLGTALLVIPPVIRIWITPNEILLHPMTLHQRIPIQHVHDMELQDQDDTLILYLRNGETVEISEWFGDPDKIAALLNQLGVSTREEPTDDQIKARQSAGPKLV